MLTVVVLEVAKGINWKWVLHAFVMVVNVQNPMHRLPTTLVI